MPLADVRLILREIRDEAEGTSSFLFGADGLAGARAGQYLLVKLDAPEDPRRGSRSFTMANAPSEPLVMITTRMRPASPFKRRLGALRPGDPLAAKGPLGKFVLRDGDGPALFLAGGIGVTPFRSMIRHAIASGRTGRIVLLTSDRTPEAIPFRAEIDGWASEHPWLRVERTVTQPSSGGTWRGRTGRIDAGWIADAGPHSDRTVAYVAGPPPFVAGLVDAARSAGFPTDRIVSESFLGY